MKSLKLVAVTAIEQRILAYLQENASDSLAKKINAGTKTIAGSLKYCQDEARKQAEEGASCACIDDETVFGWIVHFFEEEDIKEESAPVKRTVSGPNKPIPSLYSKKPEAKSPTTKPVQKQADDRQMDMFSGLFGGTANA